MVLWLIGMSGAGKTVVGQDTKLLLEKIGRKVIFIDGDSFRDLMGDDLGHSMEDRKRNADRICRFCRYISNQGIDVVAGVLSLFHEHQRWNRKNNDTYFEVYLEVDIETVMERDSKGLYSRGRNHEIKDVVGLDLPFNPPESPDLVIKNNAVQISISQISKLIVETLLDRQIIERS